MRLSTYALVVICSATVASGCDRRTPTEPIAPRLPEAHPTAPPPRRPATPPRVVSGVDLSPVAGAQVSINATAYSTDATGAFAAEIFTNDPLDVDAPGFLPRRTRYDGSGFITLWPVANEAESAAVRAMVYQRGKPQGEVLVPAAAGQ